MALREPVIVVAEALEAKLQARDACCRDAVRGGTESEKAALAIRLKGGEDGPEVSRPGIRSAYSYSEVDGERTVSLARRLRNPRTQ